MCIQCPSKNCLTAYLPVEEKKEKETCASKSSQLEQAHFLFLFSPICFVVIILLNFFEFVYVLGSLMLVKYGIVLG